MPPKDAYLESQILTAEPLELVRMLYRAAGDATRRAQVHLAAGRIAERSREISKVLAILGELHASLDLTRGGTLSRSLLELYDYLQRRLLKANLRQKPEPLVEVAGLLTTLLEAWEQVHPAGGRPDGPAWPAAPTGRSPASEYDRYPAGPFLAPDSAPEMSAQSWSF